MIRKIFRWIFKNELSELDELKSDLKIKQDKLNNLFENIDVSVDVNQRSPSWAVISIQGKQDYIKFIDLGQSEIRDIQHFLRHFERNVKVDASPQMSNFIKCGRF